MTRIMKKFAIISLVAMMAVGATACGGEHSDAGAGEVTKGRADIMAYPDGFPNIAKKCDGPNMVYSVSRGSDGSAQSGSGMVVANDPRCKR